MITVGVKDAKNNLSRHLARVKKSEELRITERGGQSQELSKMVMEIVLFGKR